jgi:N-acetylmuramoyl-L-alanine amidase CwlA
MAVNITKNFVTNNRCYKNAQTITVKGLMLHSVGCAQPTATVFRNSWDTSSVSVCVHAFIDGNSGNVLQILPWNYRAWHCGSGGNGSGNNTHIGVEMCEPSCIKYTGGSTFTTSNLTEARAVAKRTYEAAVELFASLCKTYSLNPTSDGVIISHKEGHSRGIASDHGDPEHLWKGLGLSYTMDGFRKDVASVLNGGSISAVDTSTDGTDNVVSTSTGDSTGSSSATLTVEAPVVEIEPNPNIMGMQPIFPFVELSIGDFCISSFDDDFSDTVIDFTYHRTTYYAETSQAGSKFDITLYDDTAVEVEEKIASALNDGGNIIITIKYGYSLGGEERYMTSELTGQVAKYGLSFEGIGLTLTLSGTTQDYSSAVGNVKTEEYDADTYQGKPSEIVKKICEDEGWEIGYIEETESCYDNDGTTLKTFRRESMSSGMFILYKLCEEATSAVSGDVGYRFFLDGKTAYFFPTSNTAIDAMLSQNKETSTSDTSVTKTKSN